MTTAGAEAPEEWHRVAGRSERLHRLGCGRFDADELLRLALQRLWIALGEAARRYCEAEGVGNATRSVSSHRPLAGNASKRRSLNTP